MITKTGFTIRVVIEIATETNGALVERYVATPDAFVFVTESGGALVVVFAVLALRGLSSRSAGEGDEECQSDEK